MPLLISLPVFCWHLRVEYGCAGPATTNVSSVDKLNTDENEGGLSWLKTAATAGRSPLPVAKSTLNHDPVAEALSGRPVATTTKATEPRSTPVGGGTPSDWLAAAASGHTQRENNGATGTAPCRKSSNDHGGAWMTAGKLGLSVGGCANEDDNNVRNTKVRSLGTKAAVAGATAGTNEADSVLPVASTGPGGWLATAAASGRLGVLGGDDMDNDGEAGSNMDDLRSTGVTIETQTDENIGQAVEESAKPSLPPWAKPWNPPTAVVDEHSSPCHAGKGSSHAVEKTKGDSATPPAGGLDWISATIDAPTGAIKGEDDGKRHGSQRAAICINSCASLLAIPSLHSSICHIVIWSTTIEALQYMSIWQSYR